MIKLDLIIFVLFCFHALLIAIDEFFFHHRRIVPLWERIGHPFDSLLFVIPVLIAFLLPFSLSNAVLFFIFSFLSCLIITKDEFVHAIHCTPAEGFVHALLFVLHPIILSSVFVFWAWEPLEKANPILAEMRAMQPDFFHEFLKIQIVLIFAFLLYQVVYWNVVKRGQYGNQQ